MLQLFVTNAGRVLSKQDLIEAIWPKVHVGDDSLFQCIREIRTALGDEERQLIKLVSGRGYLFEAKVSVEPGGSGVQPEMPPVPGAVASAQNPMNASTNGDLHTFAKATVKATVTPAVETPPAGRRFRVGLVALVALGAVLCLAVAVPIFAPDVINARKPPAG